MYQSSSKIVGDDYKIYPDFRNVNYLSSASSFSTLQFHPSHPSLHICPSVHHHDLYWSLRSTHFILSPIWIVTPCSFLLYLWLLALVYDIYLNFTFANSHLIHKVSAFWERAFFDGKSSIKFHTSTLFAPNTLCEIIIHPVLIGAVPHKFSPVSIWDTRSTYLSHLWFNEISESIQIICLS